MHRKIHFGLLVWMISLGVVFGFSGLSPAPICAINPSIRLVFSPEFEFNSFADCNMAEAWADPNGEYYLGPSVSWNGYLQCWVMLMARSEGPGRKGSGIYISYNTNPDFGTSHHSHQWSKPKLLISKPGHTLWYPSLQPLNSEQDKAEMNTPLRLGKKARLFYRDILPDKSEYVSEWLVEFQK